MLRPGLRRRRAKVVANLAANPEGAANRPARQRRGAKVEHLRHRPKKQRRGAKVEHLRHRPKQRRKDCK